MSGSSVGWLFALGESGVFPFLVVEVENTYLLGTTDILTSVEIALPFHVNDR